MGKLPYNLFCIFVLCLFLAACSDSETGSQGNDPALYPLIDWNLTLLEEEEKTVISKGLHENDCRPLKQILSWEFFEKQYPVHTARIVDEGACSSHSNRTVFQILSETIESKRIYTAEGLYMLGVEYLTGNETETDPEKAEILFRKAAMIAVPAYFAAFDLETRLGQEKLSDNYWAVPHSQIIRSMGNVLSGPHKIVPEFEKHQIWMDKLYARRDGAELVREAKRIRNDKLLGAFSFLSAIEWLEYAEFGFGSDEAMMTKIYWFAEPNTHQECLRKALLILCATKAKYPKNVGQLYSASIRGQKEANIAMICVLEKIEDPTVRRSLVTDWQKGKSAGKRILKFEKEYGLNIRLPSLGLTRWEPDTPDNYYSDTDTFPKYDTYANNKAIRDLIAIKGSYLSMTALLPREARDISDCLPEAEYSH